MGKTSRRVVYQAIDGMIAEVFVPKVWDLIRGAYQPKRLGAS